MALLDWYEKLEQDAKRLVADLEAAALDEPAHADWSAALAAAWSAKSAIGRCRAELQKAKGSG